MNVAGEISLAEYRWWNAAFPLHVMLRRYAGKYAGQRADLLSGACVYFSV